MKKTIAYLLSSIQLILTLAFLYQLHKLNVLPTKFFLIVTGVLLLFAALVFFLSKAKKVRFPVFIITIIFIGLLAVGNHYLNITNNLFEKVVVNPAEDPSYNDEYISIITLSDTEIEAVSDLEGKNVGIDNSFEADKMNYASEWVMKEYPVVYNETGYIQLDFLLNALYDGSVDAIIMDSSRYSLCDDIKSDFLTVTKEVVKLKVDYSNLYALTPTPTPTNTPTPAPSLPEGGITEKPFIVYISGIDTYGTISSRSRSDTNIIMAVDPVDKKILLVSTPRDTYVPLYNVSGETKDKLTHAGLYGPECSMGTLATLYNTTIDYYVRVNFSSVIDIVEALDGIDVYSAYNFSTHHLGGHYFQKGTNHLNGNSALAFCRERYAFPDGDFQRGRNHIEVIKGLINKITSPSILVNYPDLISALSGTFQTNIPSEDLTNLIKMQLADGASWTIESMTLENTGGSSTTCYSLYGPALYVGFVKESSRAAIEKALSDLMYN